MYRILEGNEPGVVRIKVESKLTGDEYELLNFYLEHLRQEVGPVNLLCDIADIDGLNSQDLWDEMTCHLTGFRDPDRVAIVGDRHGLKGDFKVFASRLNSQLKYFTRDQIDDAWNWVKG